MTTPAFPRRDNALAPTQAVARWTARAFGVQPEDLDLAFGSQPADQLVTDLLCHCLQDPQGEPADRAELAQWTLARRLQALLAVRLADDPSARLAAVADCSACRARFEFELPLADGVQAPGFDGDPPPLAWHSPDGQHLSLRLPRAADLLAWQAQGLAHGRQLAAALVDAVDGLQPGPGFVMPEAWADTLAELLQAHDPLTALTVDAACPDCGHTHAVPVDLEARLLQHFERQQRGLLGDVARLAWAFHWSEAQVLALPAWRRAFYLARIDAMEPA